MNTLWELFEILIIFFENALIHYFIKKHFSLKYSNKVNVLISIVSVILISAIYVYFLYVPKSWLIDGFSFVLFWIVFTLIFTKGDFLEKLFWSAFLSCIGSICSVIAVIWAMFLMDASQYIVVYEPGLDRFFLILAAKTMQLLTYYYFSRFYVTHQAMSNSIYIAKLFLLVFCFIIDTTLMNVGQIIDVNSPLLVYIAVSAICVLAILMVVFFLYFEMAKQHNSLLSAQGELQYKALVERHNEELVKLNQKTKAWRHDTHNHLQYMISLARNGKTADIEKYILELGEQMGELYGVCNTGNKALDAIVSVKCAIAQAEDIPVNIDTMPMAPIRLSEIDLTSLMGNLFDNAIEACLQLDTKKRSIDLFFGMMGNMICIIMSNSTGHIDSFFGEAFATTKTDGGLHGQGLINIDHIVEAADGFVQREINASQFTTSILLPRSN